MDLKDLILTPFYILLVFIAFWFYTQLRLKNEPYGKFLLWALAVRIVGAISAGILYFYYYGYGDTIGLFNGGVNVAKIAEHSLGDYFRVTFMGNRTNLQMDSLMLLKNTFAIRDMNSHMVERIISVFCHFTFSTYTATAVFFAAFATIASWRLFQVFREMFPDNYRDLGKLILFVPSVFFWGSGIFKDTITFGSLCFLTVGSYELFIRRRKPLSSIFLITTAVFFLINIKPYIVYSFLPAMVLWIFLVYHGSIRSDFVKKASFPVVIVLSLILGFLLLQQLSSGAGRWSLDEVQGRAEDMQKWHTMVVEIYGDAGGGGSHYSLGDVSYTPLGILRTFPLAVNVTLFRPYLWEVRNPIMLMAALESLFVLFLTLRVMQLVGLRKFFGYFFGNPLVLFCMVFSIVFAFSVGFTSYNFGALVRYKIPCIPFYLAGIYLIYTLAMSERKSEELALTE